MNWFIKKCVDTLFPKTCLTCRADISSHHSHSICSKCLGEVKFIQNAHLKPGPPLDEFFPVADFSGKMRDMLHAYKYQGKDYLTTTLVDLWGRNIYTRLKSIDAIVPVPMPFWREIKRGYNQSDLLADELGRRLRIPVYKGWLKRRAQSPSQTELNKEERHTNAQASFYLNPITWINAPQSILLVDDVCTTGATLKACATLLKKAGVTRVVGSTLAQEI